MTVDEQPRVDDQPGPADPSDARWRLEDERAFLQRSVDDADRELQAGDLSAEDHAVLRPSATRCSIWWRTAIAVVAFDCATERSVHDGQRTLASMAAARCAPVAGVPSKRPLPMSKATPRTTRGSATLAHNEARADRSGTGTPRRLGACRA